MIWILFLSELRARLVEDHSLRHDPVHYPWQAAGLYCVADPEVVGAYIGTSGPMPLCHDSSDY